MKTVHRFFPLSAALVLATSCSRAGSDDDRGATSDRDTIASTTPPGAEGTVPPIAGASDWTVTPLGIGPVRVGMSVAEVHAVVEGGVKKPAELQECDYITPQRESGRLNFMVRDGRVARVDITDSAFATAAGARMGDSEERIMQLYPGQVAVSPHKYVDGHYLIVAPKAPTDSAYRLVFETDGKRVTRFRAGRMPEVTWVEGCS